MSNDVVGKLYLSVIDGVVDDSRGDFEDNGVDEMTLQELKSIWQDRLTSFGIAKMPWDPEPQPIKQDEGLYTYPSGSDGAAAAAATSFPNGNGAIGSTTATSIKKEPTDSAPSSLYLNAGQAALRAAQNIQQFAQENQTAGNLAGVEETVRGIMRKGGINSPSTSNSNGGNSNSGGGGLVLPGGGHLSQLDGANDEAPPVSTAEIDRYIAERAINGSTKMALNSGLELEIEIPKRLQKKLNQLDGLDDDDEDDDDDDDDDDDGLDVKDENGITSDLDDSDDELNFGEEEDNDEAGMIMLCLYDKVQRVKNKWKYVLKDGVANINGRDYVFSRAQGESEW